MKILFFKGCAANNSHVNNLVGSTSHNITGWNFTTMDWGQFKVLNQRYYKKCGNGKFWYGFGNHWDAGSIATKLNGCGQAILTYGNCWKDHKVEIFLNGIKIDSATGMQVNKTVAFNFTDGSILKVKEDGAIIQFNDLTISAGCKVSRG